MIELDENKVHKIEAFELEKSPTEKLVCCYVDGELRNGKIDSRGKKSKFWICNEKNMQAYLLKYSDQRIRTEEDAGQFLMCGILDQLKLPYAKYLVADFECDGVKYDAIISKNYKENENIFEMSGYAVNQKYKDTMYDNNFGEKINDKNNVEDYAKMIQFMYKKNSIDFDQLRTNMLKYCLLQYVYDMSDLHYYNISFSYDKSIGHDTFRLNPFYDCGNIGFLNFSDKKIKHNAEQYAKCRDKNSRMKFIKNLMLSNMPMLGVKTDISYIYKTESQSFTCRPNCEKCKGESMIKQAETDLATLQNELADEIIANPQLFEFYESVKKVNLDLAAKKYNEIKENTIPAFCIDMVKAVSCETSRMLDKTIKTKLDKERKLANKKDVEVKIKEAENDKPVL